MVVVKQIWMGPWCLGCANKDPVEARCYDYAHCNICEMRGVDWKKKQPTEAV